MFAEAPATLSTFKLGTEGVGQKDEMKLRQPPLKKFPKALYEGKCVSSGWGKKQFKSLFVSKKKIILLKGK